MKKLSIDNPFFTFMGNLGDLIILNLAYVITCIPVITIGMATTALYKVMLKRVRGESSYILKEYLKECAKEAKKSTMMWLPMLFAGGLLVFDILYIGRSWNVIGIGVAALLVIWLLVFCYAFPLQAQFENTIVNTWKNALYLAVRYLPCTIVMLLLNMIPAAGIVWFPGLLGLLVPIYVVVGYALTARINVIMLEKIFDKIAEA